jgi:hypothetical protein
MGLVLELPDGGAALNLADVFLTRALGEPVRWRFLAEVTRDTRGGTDPDRLASLLLRAPVKVKASWRDPGSVVLTPEATVVGVRWVPAIGVDSAEIEAQTTAPDPSPNPFVPRRRVHRAQNMSELIDRLNNVAKPVTPLRAELQRISFPDNSRASIIQDGVSDWQFFFQALDQCQFLTAKLATWLPLALVGGVDEQARTDKRWIVTPGLRAAYEEWGDIEARKIRFGEKDGPVQIEFHGLVSQVRTPEFPGAACPGVTYRRPRRAFDTQSWQSWRTQDLPRFSKDGAMLWRIEDHLYQIGRDTIGWETKLFAVPPEARVTGPLPASRLRPWLGLGKVVESSSKGPWIRAKLHGFAEGEDLAYLRLTTPFSGSDGRKGLHFVPEQGTEVKLGWSGRFDDSVLLIGNARSDESTFASPSIFLERLYTGQFDDIHVQKVGQVGVDSSLIVAIKQQTRVDSANQLRIHADGADLKMTGGIVYTGRGM